jgi:hypothetical protein
MNTRGSVAGLGVVLLVAIGLRVLVVGVDGHHGDVRVMATWAERMAEVGPWRFYDGSGAIYPALLYPLWVLGLLLDGDALTLAIKGLSIPFDLGIGILLFAVLRGSGPPVALGATALYLLNPATLLAGPVWGQVDAAGTLAFLGAMVALGSRRHAAAGALAVVATMMKPQFGLAGLVVLAVAALAVRRRGTWRPLVAAGGGIVAAYVALGLPLALHPPRYLSLLGRTATQQPETSLHAFNPWGLLVGFDLPDDPYVGVGTLLLLVGMGGALLGLRRRPSLPVVLGVAAVLVLAFYFLPTRVHERYLFPALALLAPFAVAGRRELAAYAATSLGFAASLLYALHRTTPFTVPEPWAGWLTGAAGIWAIGLVLMGSAAAWTWMLVVRRPRWPSDPRDPAA